MPVTEDFNPLTDPVPDEIPLTNAPLIRVVAQIRFPMIASIESREFIAPFRRPFARNTPSLDRSKVTICSWEKREYRLPPVGFGVSPTRPRTGEFLLPRSSLLLKPRLTPVGESSCRNLSRFFSTSKNTWIQAPLTGTESAILIG